MSFAFLNFHFIPFISPSLLCFYNSGLWVASDQHLPSSLVLVKNYTQDVCLALALLGGEIIVLLSSFQDTILHNSHQ